MDPLSPARALLPFWLPFFALLALPLGLGSGWISARILSPLAARRALASRDASWAARAALVWPARRFTALALVVVPAVLGALLGHLGGPLSILGRAAAGLGGGAAALAGYALGTWPTARRLLGTAIGARGAFLAAGAALLLVRLPHVVAAAVVTAFIPVPLSGHVAEAAALLLAAAVLALGAALGGGVLAGRALGLLRIDARLERAVRAAAGQAGVAAPRALVVAAPFPAAFMAPMRRALVFSQGALDLLDDEEAEAVAAHTMGARAGGLPAAAAETPGVTARALEKMDEATLTPPVRVGGGAGSVVLLVASALLFVAAEAGFTRALPAISRRSPLAAIALTGGEPWTISELARARAAGPREADAAPLYRAAFALDGRPGHLAEAAFVESRGGRCGAARLLADEAADALALSPVRPDPLDAHLVDRARAVARRCGSTARESGEN